MKPVRFKMIGNDNPFAIASVIEDGDIRSFRMNPEWEEMQEEAVKVVEVVAEEVKVRKPRVSKKELAE